MDLNFDWIDYRPKRERKIGSKMLHFKNDFKIETVDCVLGNKIN